MRLHTFLFAFIFGLTSMSAQESTAFDFKSQPYLQNMTNNAVSVLWLTNRSCTSYVQYGETEQLGQKAQASRHGQIDANVPVQKIRLANLKPGQKYYYRVVSKEIKLYQAYKVVYGDSVVSAVQSFTLPSTIKTKFNFLAFNDVHDQPAYIDTVCKRNPDFDFVCYNGDILGDIYNEEQILKGICLPSAKAFGGSKPFVYTRGNHETRGPESRLLDRFIDSPNGEFYNTFVWGNTAFLILDTGEDKEDGHWAYYGLADYDRYRTEQARWIQSVINTPAWKNATHRIVCGHIPASLDNEKWHGESEVVTKFLPLLNKARVDLYICGHTHEPRLEPKGKNHNFALMVGGAPASEDKGVNTTYIQVKVDGKKLTASLYRKTGELIKQLEVK